MSIKVTQRKTQKKRCGNAIFKQPLKKYVDGESNFRIALRIQAKAIEDR
jgi:hypothetical protein